MLFYYNDVVWGHFLPFPLYGKAEEKTVSTYFKQAISLEQLVRFSLMDAVNSKAEFSSTQNKKGKLALSYQSLFPDFPPTFQDIVFWNFLEW